MDIPWEAWVYLACAVANLWLLVDKFVEYFCDD